MNPGEALIELHESAARLPRRYTCKVCGWARPFPVALVKGPSVSGHAAARRLYRLRNAAMRSRRMVECGHCSLRLDALLAQRLGQPTKELP